MSYCVSHIALYILFITFSHRFTEANRHHKHITHSNHIIMCDMCFIGFVFKYIRIFVAVTHTHDGRAVANVNYEQYYIESEHTTIFHPVLFFFSIFL